MRTFTTLLAAVSVVAAVAGPATSSSAGPATDRTPLITAAFFGPDFSPNGDGAKDRSRLRFRLTKRADVDVTVRRDDGAMMVHRDLGRLDPGGQHWVWDGRRGNGTLVADGPYTVFFHATSGGRREGARSYVSVDRVNPGRLGTSRPTVYPRADAVRDRVLLAFVEDGWNPDEALYGVMSQARTSLRILDHRGRVVRRFDVTGTDLPVFRWDGTGGDGHPLAAGRYAARLTTVDPAGNTRHLTTALRVSTARLVEQTWTETVAAADAGHYTPYYGGCNGCGDICDPVPSTRFAGGLSFRPCDEPILRVVDYFATGPPFAAAPIDRYRVSSVGGPTAPGSDDIGRLVVGEQVVVDTGVGDGTTTSPWIQVQLDTSPYLPNHTQPVNWAFTGSGTGSYDVASFTIEYRHYVPEHAS
ncbi:MAG: FlgD immunoglobulin-like domain containing protein [Nocardioides sp.]